MNLQLVNQELFNGITCDVWRNDNHEIFMTTEQLAQCIGYQTRYGITTEYRKISISKTENFQLVPNWHTVTESNTILEYLRLRESKKFFSLLQKVKRLENSVNGHVAY